jgi:fructokinase
LELWLSGPASLADHAYVNGTSDITVPQLVDAAASGDEAAKATLDRHSGRVARAFSVLIKVVDPDVIVLGGGVTRIPSLIDDLNRKLPDEVFSDPLNGRIARAIHGDSSGVRGAARLWEQADS